MVRNHFIKLLTMTFILGIIGGLVIGCDLAGVFKKKKMRLIRGDKSFVYRIGNVNYGKVKGNYLIQSTAYRQVFDVYKKKEKPNKPFWYYFILANIGLFFKLIPTYTVMVIGFIFMFLFAYDIYMIKNEFKTEAFFALFNLTMKCTAYYFLIKTFVLN